MPTRMDTHPLGRLVLVALIALVPTALAAGNHADDDHHTTTDEHHTTTDEHHDADDHDHGAGLVTGADITEPATVRYTLRTSFSAGAIGFIGVGGDIDGILNPELRAEEGDIVEIVIVNDDGVEHDITLLELGVMSDHVHTVGDTASVKFRATHDGTFEYECAVTGHREAGMLGLLVVSHAGSG
jgi:FtsP/CotA-like multicopper oxidase with cupredoxin domain